jgi:hypothetical protein
MGTDTDHVAPEVREAIDAVDQLARTALAEHAVARRDLDACWQRILARVRGQVTQE